MFFCSYLIDVKPSAFEFRKSINSTTAGKAPLARMEFQLKCGSSYCCQISTGTVTTISVSLFCKISLMQMSHRNVIHKPGSPDTAISHLLSRIKLFSKMSSTS